MSTYHVMPTADLVVHEASDDCPCGPTPQFIPGGTVAVHHALDGREANE